MSVEFSGQAHKARWRNSMARFFSVPEDPIQNHVPLCCSTSKGYLCPKNGNHTPIIQFKIIFPNKPTQASWVVDSKKTNLRAARRGIILTSSLPLPWLRAIGRLWPWELWRHASGYLRNRAKNFGALKSSSTVNCNDGKPWETRWLWEGRLKVDCRYWCVGFQTRFSELRWNNSNCRNPHHATEDPAARLLLTVTAGIYQQSICLSSGQLGLVDITDCASLWKLYDRTRPQNISIAGLWAGWRYRLTLMVSAWSTVYDPTEYVKLHSIRRTFNHQRDFRSLFAWRRLSPAKVVLDLPTKT